MLLSPRAGLCAAPALIVFLGTCLTVNLVEREPAAGPAPERVASGELLPPLSALSAEEEDRVHRIALKQEIAVDLLDGRITLADAVARFGELAASDPEALEHLRQAGAGETDDQRAVYQVLAFARGQAARHRGRYAGTLARLEAEAASLAGSGNSAH